MDSRHRASNALETRMDPEWRRLDAGAARRVVTVGELARSVATLLERSFGPTWVRGEISNLMRASSGHWYFSLKDREAQVRCVLFRMRAQALDWSPREGDLVEARATAGLYAPRGEFQLQVEQMRRAGAGSLFEEFLRIKSRLEAAGLFAAARKRPLPAHPRRIGIVTSLAAAALRDVASTLVRRAPHVEVLVFHTPVQGVDAPPAIVAAIERASRASTTHDVDVILLVRGGGNIEDLWAFNDERVSQAIVAARVPVVSGVGHETDFTIADFVADLRAPTPTAAAELASPDAVALTMRVERSFERMQRALDRSLDTWTQRVDEAARRLRSPSQRLAMSRGALDALARRLSKAQAATLDARARSMRSAVDRLRRARPTIAAREAHATRVTERLTAAIDRSVLARVHATRALAERLALLDPHGIVARGYAIVRDRHGRVVRDATTVSSGDALRIDVARGSIDATVDARADG